MVRGAVMGNCRMKGQKTQKGDGELDLFEGEVVKSEHGRRGVVKWGQLLEVQPAGGKVAAPPRRKLCQVKCSTRGVSEVRKLCSVDVKQATRLGGV